LKTAVFGEGIANLKMYLDANGDGLPDNFTAITTTTAVAAGAQFKFVVAATIPGSAVDGNNDSVTVSATSTFDNTLPAQANNDYVTVTGAAVISLTKAESVTTGVPGTTIKYTLTYTNTGNSTATNVVIADTLDARLSYQTGNLARWSVTGATPLTDASGDTQNTGITIDYYASGNNQIYATINSVAPGVSGTLSFDVYVNAAVAPGLIPNTGKVSYINGVDLVNPVTANSNQVDFTVIQVGGVVLNNHPAVGNVLNAFADNYVTVASATQGATVPFLNSVHNTGTGIDTFNITLATLGGADNNYPAGTSFLFFKADGVSPLVDTNGDNIPDTGPMGVGAAYDVYVTAILPTGASGGGAYNAMLTATSTFDGTKSDPIWDQLTTITPNTVDMTNNIALPAAIAANGAGINTYTAAATAAGVITNPYANPGDTYTFALFVNNTSTTSDSFDLLVDYTGAFANPVNNIPAGWALTFHANATGTCTTVGAAISNTGTINAGANTLVCAVVNIPVSAPPGTTNFYFRVKSPTSGATDIKLDAVTVNTVRGIQITSNNAGQVFPGGTIVYTHIISNLGNVAEGTAATGAEGGASSSIIIDGYTQNTLSGNGWTSVVYADGNGNGILDAADTLITNSSAFGGLAAAGTVGDSYTLFVKVFSPSGSAVNDINATTITATAATVINTIPAPAAVFNTDNTTVIAGQVRLVKTQALDANCDGYSDAGAPADNYTAGYSTANITAKPGACIRYSVKATNEGSANVTGLIVSDSTPANTTYHFNAATTSAAAVTGAGSVNTITAPTNGNAGTISANIGTLTPTAFGTVTFGVQIAP